MSRRPVGLAAALALGLAVLAACAAVGWLSLQDANPVPNGDESLHLTRVLELEALLRRTRSGWERAALWLFSGDAYPNGLYSTSFAFLLRDPSIAGARTTLLAFATAHAALALALGWRRWGPAGAMAYAALVTLSPAALACNREYLLDGPLMAAVGVAVLAAEASEGFRRVGATLVFLVATVVGLYLKWTFFLFGGLPLALAAAQALAAVPTWRARAGWALGLAAAAAAGVVAIAQAGAAWERRPMGSTALVIVLGGVALAAVWALAAAVQAGRGRPFPGVLNLAAALVTTVAVAGPWYALVWGSLWGRYAHEQRMYASRAATATELGVHTLRLLLPLGELLLVVGLAWAIVAGRGRLAWVARVLGGAIAAAVTVEGLPPGPRYLLPILPLAAGALVAGWGGGGRVRRAFEGLGAAVVAGGLGLVSVGPLLGRDPGWPAWPGDPPALAVSVRRLGRWPVAVLARSPAPATAAEVADFVQALRVACPDRCTVGWSRLGAGGLVISGREVQALGRWAGLAIDVHDVGADDPLPGGGALRGQTVCPPMTTIRPDPGAAGWTDGTWRSGPLSGGCRLTLTRGAALSP